MNLTSILLSDAFPGYAVSLTSRPDKRVLMTLMRLEACAISKVIDAQALFNPAMAAKVIWQVERDLKLKEGGLKWHTPDDHWISRELPTYHENPLWQRALKTLTGRRHSRFI